MTVMTLAVFEYVLAAYGSTLTTAAGVPVTTTKGYPTWGREAAQVPCAALELMAWEPSHNRAGQRAATGATGYRGWIFARNEPELCTLKDALVVWHQENSAFDIAARRVECLLLEIKRHDPQSDSQLEAHGITFLLQAVW